MESSNMKGYNGGLRGRKSSDDFKKQGGDRYKLRKSNSRYNFRNRNQDTYSKDGTRGNLRTAPSFEGKYGKTGFVKPKKKYETEVKRLLNNIKTGYSGELQEKKIRDLFFYLVRESRYKGVTAFLEEEKGFNINTEDDKKKTALMLSLEIAAKPVTEEEIQGYRNMIEKQVDEEVAAEIGDKSWLEEDKRVVTEKYIKRKRKGVIEILLNNGASVAEVIKDENYVTWLENIEDESVKRLFEEKRREEEISRRLEEEKENLGDSYASDKSSMYEDSDDSTEEERLLSRGEDIVDNIRKLTDRGEYTVAELLDNLIGSGDYTTDDLVRLKDVRDDEGYTVLAYLMARNTLERGSLEVMDQIKALINAGADVDERDFFGATILHHAIMAQDEEFVKEICTDDKYSDIALDYSADCYGNSALEYAGEFGNRDIFEYLAVDKNWGDKYVLWRALEMAAKAKNVKALSYMLNSCPRYKEFEDKELLVNFNERDDEGRTVFMFVAECGNENMCKYFIEKGIDLNIEDIYGRTALTNAVEGDNLVVVKFLLENGALIDHKMNAGITELMHAVLLNRKNIYEYLIEHGANVDATDDKGRTALMIAAKQGNKDALWYLIEHKANIDIVDKDGNRFEDYADAETKKYINAKLRVKVAYIPKESEFRKSLRRISEENSKNIRNDTQGHLGVNLW